MVLSFWWGVQDGTEGMVPLVVGTEGTIPLVAGTEGTIPLVVGTEGTIPLVAGTDWYPLTGTTSDGYRGYIAVAQDTEELFFPDGQ
jgi:hypothetical protein